MKKELAQYLVSYDFQRFCFIPWLLCRVMVVCSIAAQKITGSNLGWFHLLPGN